jgi:hypothetical protein
MNDTSTKFAALVEHHYARLTALQRMQVAAGLYETARRIAWSAVPSGLSAHEHRLRYIRRMYGDELPEAAYQAFARASATGQ